MSDVRVRKLQEFIKQEVSQMLMRGLKDPRIGFTTITDVHVTGDLREAKHAAGHIRTELGKVLKLRHIPSITFDKDTSLDYSMHIESLLNEIKKDEEIN